MSEKEIDYEQAYKQLRTKLEHIRNITSFKEEETRNAYWRADTERQLYESLDDPDLAKAAEIEFEIETKKRIVYLNQHRLLKHVLETSPEI